MRYNEQTGGVEIELSELCALAFGRNNYKEESASEQDAEALCIASDVYYKDVQLQHTCRYAGVLIKVTATAQGISVENGQYSLDYTVRSSKLPDDNEPWTVPIRQRCLAYFLASVKELQTVNVRRITATAKGEWASFLVWSVIVYHCPFLSSGRGY